MKSQILIKCVHIQISKQLNVDQKQMKNTEDNFFPEISLYYVDLHIDDVMTKSWMSCEFDRKAL